MVYPYSKIMCGCGGKKTELSVFQDVKVKEIKKVQGLEMIERWFNG